MTDRMHRAARLVAQHKLGAAMAALLVVAAIVGVASGSLNGAPPGTAGTPSASRPAAAPSFTLAALAAPGQGRPAGSASGSQQVSLSQYQGRPLIVNFWASWCGPCQQETPLLASFYKAQGGQVVIVGVDSNDTTAKAIAFLRAKGVTYPIGVDPRLITADAYDVAAFPQTFFLDSAHRVVDRVFGPLTTATLDKGVQLMTPKDDTSGKLPVSYIQAWDGYSPGKYEDVTSEPRRAIALALAAVVFTGVSACGVLLMTGGTAPPRPDTVAKSTGQALSDRAIYARIAPAVVDVSSSLRYDAETADGTGFVINAAAALILTNNHVIRDATAVTVTLTSTGRQYPARIVGTDGPADVALLQLQGAAGANRPAVPGLVAAPVGDSRAVAVGAPVLAIGNQAGAGGAPAVTAGVISDLGQTIQANDVGSGFTETLHNMLQTSAHIAAGDSGGPLADKAGQVIGVNTAAGSGTADRSGYAIPINDALTAARLIAAGQPAPGVTMGTHGFLGVVLARPGAHPSATNPRPPAGIASAPPACAPTIAAAAASAPAPSSRPGALVAGALCGTGAAAAGLAAGDVITSANGHRITSPGALTALMSACQPGTLVRVTWISASGHPRSSQVRLDTAPAVLPGGCKPSPQTPGHRGTPSPYHPLAGGSTNRSPGAPLSPWPREISKSS